MVHRKNTIRKHRLSENDFALKSDRFQFYSTPREMSDIGNFPIKAHGA